VQWNKTKQDRTCFQNAKFWTNENHWEWATKPNQEKASFLSENILPMQSGQLNFIKRPGVTFWNSQN
jgi:hypothetical protein